ncbi:tetratricopeptide (TPR) repeat protein [Wenyingzhuangia heitensis]|uniref:Tetratricopeptide (TPR) repeat protein n=1 Tax=Wenyingzhuangia heitensis TaxID=1487859 RepID=A0ABX0UAQ9_9FLAO|nr:tetratricopeptide repeat protein [Wenyingzhuangia heitensis]NIJ44546.1 tetratricopeptide (TPR) repeat protein [Wenyingzhuangia heitensis]
MLKTNDVYFFDTTEFEEIIHYYLDEGNTSMAKKAVFLALEQHPDSADIKLIQAEIMVFEDKLDQARALLDNLMAIYPSNEEVYIQIANLLSKKDNHKEAIKYLEIAKKYTDDLADVSSLLGMEYLYLDDYQKSRTHFSVCLDADLEDYQALYNIIYCYEMESAHKEAIAFLDDYINKNPYCEVAWHQIGRQYFVLKEYKKALKSFDYAVIIDESFIGGYIEKAKTLEKLQRFDEAIKNYQITLDLDDPTAYAYLRIGECYKKKGNATKAIYFYKKALHEDPLLDKCWMLLSVISSEEKSYDKALHYLNKAIALDETNVEYLRFQADINLKLNFYEEAAESLENCIELGESGVDVWVTLADIWVLIGEYETALLTLVKAKRQHTNFSEIEYRLACLFYTTDRKKEAYLHLKTALTLDFDYHLVIKDLYPVVFKDLKVKRMVSNFLEN